MGKRGREPLCQADVGENLSGNSASTSCVASLFKLNIHAYIPGRKRVMLVYPKCSRLCRAYDMVECAETPRTAKCSRASKS